MKTLSVKRYVVRPDTLQPSFQEDWLNELKTEILKIGRRLGFTQAKADTLAMGRIQERVRWGRSSDVNTITGAKQVLEALKIKAEMLSLGRRIGLTKKTHNAEALEEVMEAMRYETGTHLSSIREARRILDILKHWRAEQLEAGR